MRFSIFRNKKDGTGLSVQAIECNSLIDSMKEDTQDKIVRAYRDVFLALDKPEGWERYKNIPRVCPVSEYYRNKVGEHVWRCLTGAVMLEIRGINNVLELQKAKKAVSVYPQVLAAFQGADRYSLVVLMLASGPNNTLPKTEDDALAFISKAYSTAVMCLQPTLAFPITIKEPTLDATFLRTVDPEPYVNTKAIPFVLEASPRPLSPLSPKEGKSLFQSAPPSPQNRDGKTEIQSPLVKMQPGYDTFATYRKVFNACYQRALDGALFISSKDADKLIVRIAEECVLVGLPQEETTVRIHHHFHEVEIEDVRAAVQNVYNQLDDRFGQYGAFTKHQRAAYRLREFLDRRYDIRFNEVLQMTEFREKQSLVFVYREMNRRELNTIHHEALIEGIEATFGEVDEIVHSSRVPLYNPIMDYLSRLPHWDGKDRIKALADLVSTDNPYWHRLFRQWFLSMVAHWMNGDERHANSTAPILIGAQGYRKSTFCRLLLPPELQIFYTDSIDFRTNIEAERTLSRFMLVNIDEFDQLSEKQFAFVKHLFQKPATNIRRMYSETIASQRRYASFIGTTNSDEVLRDPTGNRRYLCVYVTNKINTEAQIDYAQLYSQAVALINQGERYWINDEDEALIRETNSRFEVQQPLEQLFLTAFCSAEDTTEENGQWMRVTEIMAELQAHPSYNKKTDNSLPKLGRILTKLQVTKRRLKSGMEYLVRQR